MKKWKHKLDVSDVFHNDEVGFEELRDTVVSRIRTSSFYRKAARESMEFEDVVEELSEVETVDQFDFIWSAVYDYADYYDCWITTR